ncbi:hypothetical protein NP493_594g02015 [Ridgeia piscesae]|uniref:Uncharacterized protein n=1 Tax=Ridgeia piscesae TaxID=27915 RepID=A0AAD9KTR7_RIDPI|nr:hypothetical protein NP493_594g02015 [Ridgeia piscesae]
MSTNPGTSANPNSADSAHRTNPKSGNKSPKQSVSPAASGRPEPVQRNDSVRNATMRRGQSDMTSVHKGERIEGGLKLLDIIPDGRLLAAGDADGAIKTGAAEVMPIR